MHPTWKENSKVKKVLFAITNLDIGGAEKVLVNLAIALKDTYDITILTLWVV